MIRIAVLLAIIQPILFFFFFFNDTAPTEIYPLPLHAALPICPTLELLRNPQSAYTRRLLADAPSLAPAPRRTPRPATADDWAIEVEDLVHEFAAPGHASAHGRGIFRAVDGVSLRVRRGSTHAIVGESGSGKTTTIRAIVGLGRPTAGRIRIEGTEVTGLRGEALRQLRRRVQLVYQNPFSSLDPRQSVFDIIEEPLLNFDPLPADERRQRVHDIGRASCRERV